MRYKPQHHQQPSSFVVLATLFFLLSLFSVSASSEYLYNGFDDNLAGPTKFVDGIDASVRSNTIASPEYVPLMVDMDGDGVPEIIIKSGTQVRLYNRDTLVVLGSHTLINVSDPSPFVMVDDDADGDFDIYVVERNNDGGHVGELFKVTWNGTVFQQFFLADDAGPGGPVDLTYVGCDDSSLPIKCLIVSIDTDVPGNSEVNVWGYNGTAVGSVVLDYNDAVGDVSQACPPNVPTIKVADYDHDGVNEFIFSYYIVGENNEQEGFRISVYRIAPGSGNVTKEVGMSKTFANYISVDDGGCFDTTEKGWSRMSNPYIADIDDSPGNGDEIVIAAMVADGEIKMFSFSPDGSLYDDYPEFAVMFGDHASDIFLADAFSDTGTVDFCMSTQTAIPPLSVVFCASEQTSEVLGFGDSERWTGPLVNTAGPISDRPVANSFFAEGPVHEVFFTSAASFIFEKSDECGTLCDMEVDYQVQNANATLLLIDAQNTGYADLYYLTRTNLWFFDDNTVNLGCGQSDCITSIFYNPTRLRTWKINSTVEILVAASDIDLDDVAVRVTLYANKTNEQTTGWTDNFSSGTTFGPFSFTANTTVASGIIRIEARDNITPGSIQTIERSFSVALAGIVFGEQTSTETFEPVEEEDVVTLPEDADTDNVVTNAVTSLDAISGIGGASIWILLMIAVAVGIWFAAPHESPGQTMASFGAIVLIEFLMVIIGNRFGFVSFGIAVAFIVVAVAVIAVAFRQVMTGD